MNTAFGEIFLFLTDLAWKSRITIPMLVTTAFLIMDIRLQIEINIHSGQVATADLDDFDNSDGEDNGNGEDADDDDDDEIDEEYTTDGSTDDDDNGFFYFQVESSRGGDENQNTLNRTGAIVSI